VFADGNYPNQTSEASVISGTGIVGLILEGNRFANVKGRAVVVSNSAFDFNDGLFIVDNIISGTTDSALYLALRYDGLTITGNRIDGVGIDGSNPQKAAAIYVTHGSTFGGLTTVGLTPFAFYNPFDVASGQQIGSNYDSTGNNTQGRVTVVFRGNWAQATDIARTNLQGLGLIEVA
jgi:hypothetical protein